MNTRRLLMLLIVGVFAGGAVFAQFSPRKDYVWARDVLGATITLDGNFNEAAWAKADSIVIQYGVKSGNPEDGWKVMNGTAPVGNGANAVVKFLVNKTTNTLYLAITSKDSSVGGAGWEACDGLLAGIYNRRERANPSKVALHQDIFTTWIDSAGAGQLPNMTAGALPSRNIVTGVTTVQGQSNVDTNGVGQRVADQGWRMELAVKLDSLGYNANSVTTDAVQMTICIWDRDWSNTPSFVGTKAWWGNEWGNNGGGLAGRVLVRSDVNINTTSLPAYPYDRVIPNGTNFAAPTVDGSLADAVWSHVPSFTIQYGNDANRAAYPTIGPEHSGQFAPTGVPFDAGVATVKMFFLGDKLYIGADVADQSVNHAVSDDWMDALQISMNIPIDSLRDPNVHFMGRKRFGIQVDSVAKGGSSVRWADELPSTAGALTYGLALKSGTTIDNNNDVDNGYTVEAVLDLAKLGYTAGAPNKVVALGFNLHDVDFNPAGHDTAASRTWWFREWPWAASPAFCLLDNATLVTGVGDQDGSGLAQEFRLYGNYPNPFNPSTKIRFSLPGSGTATLTVFDILGRQVSTAGFAVTAGGVQEHSFNAAGLASGVYFYRLEFVPGQSGAQRYTQTKSMMLLK